MNNLVWLFGIATINGLILGYAGNMQTTTKWLGKRLFLHKYLHSGTEAKVYKRRDLRTCGHV